MDKVVEHIFEYKAMASLGLPGNYTQLREISLRLKNNLKLPNLRKNKFRRSPRKCLLRKKERKDLISKKRGNLRNFQLKFRRSNWKKNH